MGIAVPSKWTERADGSLWAACEIGGREGVVAIVIDAVGRVSITAIVQINATNAASVDDAKREVESWLERTRASTAEPLADC